jgi:hypothetical protein
MDVSFVITRLAAQLTGLKKIGGSADLDAAAKAAPPTPSMFVMPLAESGKPGGTTAVYRQPMLLEFSVISVVANQRDATGNAALADLVALRTQLKAALIGWVPNTEDGEPVEFIGGRLLQFDDGRLWWADQFRLASYYTAAD